VRKHVDDILEAELENIKISILGAKRKKRGKGKRKGKGKRNKKGKRGKKGKIPGARLVGSRAPDDLLAELVEKGIVRKIVPA